MLQNSVSSRVILLTFIFNCVHVCAHTREYRCPKDGEKGVMSPGAIQWDLGLGNWSSAACKSST